MKLGPVSVYGDVEQYSYSLVSGPSSLYLFVLVRDVEEFRLTYEADVLDWLENNGFNSTVNNPIETYHGDDCGYPEF